MLDLSGSYTFNASQDIVWDALQNPRLLGTIIPTCWGVESTGINKFRGILKFSVGPTAGIFEGEIELSNIQEPNGYEIVVNGKAPIGIVRIKGKMNLEPDDKDNTIMHYSGNVSFGGRIASVGSRMLEMAINAMIKQSFEALNQYFITNKRNSL